MHFSQEISPQNLQLCLYEFRFWILSVQTWHLLFDAAWEAGTGPVIRNILSSESKSYVYLLITIWYLVSRVLLFCIKRSISYSFCELERIMSRHDNRSASWRRPRSLTFRFSSCDLPSSFWSCKSVFEGTILLICDFDGLLIASAKTSNSLTFDAYTDDCVWFMVFIFYNR